MKYSLATITVLSLLGCMTTPAHANNSSVENLIGRKFEYSTFYRALVNTGVASELDENTEYTVFVPTNEVFDKIQPNLYPCFYSAQCRPELAAILRNHIVPRNESIQYMSKWGMNPIQTLGNRGIRVEETYNDVFAVEGLRVLYQNRGDRVSIYPIYGIIVSEQEMAQFRRQPVAYIPSTVTEKTVTTYSAPATYPVVYREREVVGGTYEEPVVYMNPNGQPMDITQTTTITKTKITQ